MDGIIFCKYLKKLLKIYGWYFPCRKGKKRIIDKIYHTCRWSEKCIIKTKFDALLEVELSEYIQRRIFFEGVYEPHILDLMKILNNVQQIEIFFDVGANIGQHSIFAAIKMGVPLIYAFEPCHTVVAKLKRNIKLNNLEHRIIVVEKALLDVEKECIIISPSFDNKGLNYIYDNFRLNNFWGNKCYSITLDTFLLQNNLEKVDLLKIDVEGAEMKVLKGAQKAISQKIVSFIIIEICEKHLNRFGDSPEKLIHFLEKEDYRGFLIRNYKLVPILKVQKLKSFEEAIFVSKEKLNNFYQQVKKSNFKIS